VSHLSRQASNTPTFIPFHNTFSSRHAFFWELSVNSAGPESITVLLIHIPHDKHNDTPRIIRKEDYDGADRKESFNDDFGSHILKDGEGL
jgi:hypothetical protein